MWRELQRIISRTEPELGLGAIKKSGDDGFLEVSFPRSGEVRRYSLRNAPLHRFILRTGQKAALKDGSIIEVTTVDEDEKTGLVKYGHKSGMIWEYELEDRVHDQGALDQFFSGNYTHHRTYDLRRDARKIHGQSEETGIQGLVGPKVTPLPHQLYIAKEISRRVHPRVLLSDEVGLGKTIEAGLIFSSLKALGRAERVLIVVPESLVHQWMAEMFRRFHQLFSVLNEERCEEEISSQNMSAFLANQYVIVSMDFLLNDEVRRNEALNVDWDLIIIDEAHHLRWDPEEPDPKWSLSKELSRKSEGLLLLTATPQQYGLPTHFGLLNLVDSKRFNDFDEFVADQAKHSVVAKIASELSSEGLGPELKEKLVSIFAHDPEISELIGEEESNPGLLMNALIDRHGTGRVLFRNRRSRLKGFPKRKLYSIPLEPNGKVIERLKKAKDADELMLMDLATGRWNERVPQILLEHSPKFEWLQSFASENKGSKTLVLCGSSQGVLALSKGMKDLGYKIGIFHEQLSVVERDQQAAYFAEPEGADFLICSEIGGEGRNFQFAKNLIFMDLPRHPDLVEQRIGRLDRIGQRHDVQIYVPWIKNTPEEVLFRWYHEGLDSFRSSWNGAAIILDEFIDEIFDALGSFLPTSSTYDHREELVEKLIRFSTEFAAKIRQENEKSVDLLVDLNSFDEEKGHAILDDVEDVDDDPSVEFFIRSFFDHFGVEYDDYDDRGSIVVRPDTLMFVEKIPGLEGLDETVMTFDRDMALKREDMTFLTRDHSIVDGCLSILLDRNEGVASVCKWPDSPHGQGVLIEFSIVMEAQGPKNLELGRFLPPQSYELSYSHKGKRVREKRHKNDPFLLKELSENEARGLAGQLTTILEPIVAKCQDKSARWAEEKIQSSMSKAQSILGHELSRLKALAVVNPLVSEEEVATMEERLRLTLECLERAQPRIDAVRLIFTR